MKTNPPTHEEITRRAHDIWTDRDSPNGHDLSIWLEAERQLTADSCAPSDNDSPETHSSFDPFGRNHNAAKAEAEPIESARPDPLETAAKSAQLKHAASAPRMPTHRNAPRSAPTESGKPLWNQPHSS